jgi:DNA-directed RNA polymerase I, II, and III subunit RPABC2
MFLTTHILCSDDQVFEEDEINEYYDPEVGGDDDEANHGENGEDQDNVVVSGDPSAAANALKSGDKSVKDKKIPESERTTTPYMTKYERARILGTRALQIRFAWSTERRLDPGQGLTELAA